MINIVNAATKLIDKLNDTCSGSFHIGTSKNVIHVYTEHYFKGAIPSPFNGYKVEVHTNCQIPLKVSN